MAGDKGAPLPIVLIVDDEPYNRDLLRRVLAGAYRVREAGNMSGALSDLESAGPVDVLLADHLMPGGSGTELARRVRATWPGTVALLLTGVDDDPEVVRARDEGIVVGVIGKPWNAPDVRAAVAQALVSRAAAQ